MRKMERNRHHSTQIPFFLLVTRGCAGNTQGVAALVIGMTVDEAIRRLKGIQCRNGTSCPDQLATALEEYKANHAA